MSPFILSGRVTNPIILVDVGRDPKFFFGNSVGPMLTFDGNTFVESPVDRNMSGQVVDKSVDWSHDVSMAKYIPSQGPWGVIPSRNIMITNLPKTTQLWTLVELLKVKHTSTIVDIRAWAIGLVFSLRLFHLMDLQLCPSMTFVMHFVVSVTFEPTISSETVDWIHTSFPS
jgi:hypothetical protein